jgi:hypothetical protein
VTNVEASPIDALNYLLFHLITAPSTANLKEYAGFSKSQKAVVSLIDSRVVLS